MDMKLSAADFMTLEQKTEVGEALKTKLIAGIDAMELSKAGKLNIATVVNDEIRELAEGGNLFDYVDLQGVGKAFSKKIIEGIG